MIIYSVASSVLLKYYHRVINKKSSNLAKESLIENINLHNLEQKNWHTKLDRIMHNLDLCKLIKPTSSIKMIGKVIIKTLKSNYEQYWEQELNKDSNK